LRSSTSKRTHINNLRSFNSNLGILKKGQSIPLFQRFLPIPWELWPSEARLLLALIAFWSISGLFVLGSASWWVASKEMGDGAYFLKRQIIWLCTSWVVAWLAISISLRKWLKLSRYLLPICLALVAATLFFGTTINGSSRWLILGAFRLQPSELVKPFVILQAANLFAQWERINNNYKLFNIGIFSILILLIIKQPNLSTAGLIGILLWMMALGSGLKFKYLFTSAFSGFSIGSLSILNNQYQMLRVKSFLDPWQDAQHTGYQLTQSLMAIGSGGFFGEGYGLSTQKLLYLPFLSTDFIFSVFAEEFGFVGSLMLILFLILFAFLALKVSLSCRNNYSKLIAIGCCTLLIGQSIMHLSVASGVMPTTGLPLPIISYGGNSLLSSLFIGGLLIRCALESTGLVGGVKIKKKFSKYC